jgi:hypothetical protein
MLRRYWFEFEIPQAHARLVVYGLGCGVTAYNYDDAISLMKELVFSKLEMPPIRSVIEDVDVSTLDVKHVRVNMGVPVNRGVWFPLSPPSSG